VVFFGAVLRIFRVEFVRTLNTGTNVPVFPLVFFRGICFFVLSGVLGIFDSGLILEMYVVLLYFPFKNAV